MPRLAVAASANLESLIYFGVRVRFVPPLIPSPASEDSHPVIERLLEIDAESVFDGCLQRMSGDLGDRCQTGLKTIDRLTVASHVCVIHKREEANNAVLLPQD